ncbi:MAG: hypothetical protein QXF09_01105 [Nitrososphaerota archaeon]
MEENSESKNSSEVYEIELSYIDTPKGKVATYESSKKIAEALMLISSENEKIIEKISQIESSGISPEKISFIENSLKEIKEMLIEIAAQLDVLSDTLQELTEIVTKIKKEE